MVKKPKADGPFASKLADNKEAWLKASKEASENPMGQFKDLPDGRYKIKLNKAVLGKKSNGEDWCRWEWKVLEGEHVGLTQSSFDNLVTHENMVHFARKIEFFGYSAEDMYDEEGRQQFLDDLVDGQEDTITAQFKGWANNTGQSGVNVHPNVLNEGDPISDYETGTEESEPLSWEVVGKQIDELQDVEGLLEKSIISKAEKFEIDVNEYGPWEDLGTALDDKESEATTPVVTNDLMLPSGEPPTEEPTWTDLGAGVDNEKDSDGSLEKSMRDACKVHDIDPEAIATWVEVGTKLDELEIQGDSEETESETDDEVTAEEVRGWSSDELLEFAKASDSELDENTYDSWEAYAEALIKEFELEGSDPAPDPPGDESVAELVVGANVICVYKGKEINGTVEALDEKAGTVTVKPDGKGKVMKVGVDAVEIQD